MTRRLITSITAASLLLCAAVAAVWLRAAFVSDRVVWGAADGAPVVVADWVNVRTFRGGLLLRWDRRQSTGGGLAAFDAAAATGLRWERAEAVPMAALYPQSALRTRAGVGFERSRTVYGGASEVHTGWRLAVPFWALACVAAAPPAAGLWRRRCARRRVKRGLCSRCAYDLRASGGRCPECGTERVAPPMGPETSAV